MKFSSTVRSGFFSRADAGISASGYIKAGMEQIEAEHTKVDAGGRKYIDVMSPEYHSKMAELVQAAVPDIKDSGGRGTDDIWQMPASSRESALAAKPGSYEAEILYRNADVDGFRAAVENQHGPAGDTGRYVTLRHGEEVSGYLMELEPDGDIHRFLDLECPEGEARMLQIPQTDYTVDQVWESSPLIQYGIENARKCMARDGMIETSSPPGCLLDMHARSDGPVAFAGMKVPTDLQVMTGKAIPALPVGFDSSDSVRYDLVGPDTAPGQLRTAGVVQTKHPSTGHMKASRDLGQEPYGAGLDMYEGLSGMGDPVGFAREVSSKFTTQNTLKTSAEKAKAGRMETQFPGAGRAMDGLGDPVEAARSIAAGTVTQAMLQSSDEKGRIQENEARYRIGVFVRDLAGAMGVSETSALGLVQSACQERLDRYKSEAGKQDLKEAFQAPEISPTERMMRMDRERWGGQPDSGPGLKSDKPDLPGGF